MLYLNRVGEHVVTDGMRNSKMMGRDWTKVKVVSSPSVLHMEEVVCPHNSHAKEDTTPKLNQQRARGCPSDGHNYEEGHQHVLHP